MNFRIRPLTAADAPACDAIVLGLPDFFGYGPGRADCARAVRSQAGWVAEESGCVVGFATWTPADRGDCRGHRAAIDRECRHRGIGTQIIEALADDVRNVRPL